MNKILHQPTFNIGMVGHVSHGKSSCVRALTGIETFKHTAEKERGITMKIGYANCKIFQCGQCSEPQCYQATSSKVKIHKCIICDSETKLIQYFSFVDCPGHDSLMSAMLSGTTVMDYAILLIDGSQKCPQPQTTEHLAALEIMKLKKIIIVQNKLDLIDGNKAMEQYVDIQNFVKGTCAESVPIIPLSAQKKYNLDILCEYIVKYFGQDFLTNESRNTLSARMNIIRSFDVNKPGCNINDLTGGVVGGSLVSGQLSVGDVVEIRPGLVKKDTNGKLMWQPLRTTIVSIKTDSDDIREAHSGGLIGVCTNLDPFLTRSDRMVGQVIGRPDAMPDVHLNIRAKCKFMKRVDPINASQMVVTKPKINEMVLLNVSSKPVIATVTKISGSKYTFELNYPCCMSPGEKFSVSCKIGGSWRLSGMASFSK